jgi:hypothetical protein
MPYPRKAKIGDPLNFDRAADIEDALAAADLPGGETLLRTTDLAKRWRMTPDAVRKQRERNVGPPFICLTRRRILYRLADVLNYEANHTAFRHDQARYLGLLL